MMRVFGDVPYVSGHALFLTYAIMSRGSRVVRVTATLVMIEVIYLKLFVWHDFITLPVLLRAGERQVAFDASLDTGASGSRQMLYVAGYDEEIPQP